MPGKLPGNLALSSEASQERARKGDAQLKEAAKRRQPEHIIENELEQSDQKQDEEAEEIKEILSQGRRDINECQQDNE